MGRCRQNSWLVQNCKHKVLAVGDDEETSHPHDIHLGLYVWFKLSQVSNIYEVLWKTGEKTKECCVFCRTRRVSASGKARLCWKNILVMSVISLDSSFVPVGHQLHQWIPSFKWWTFSRSFAFMCKRAGTAQWRIPIKYNAWVWLVEWMYLTFFLTKYILPRKTKSYPPPCKPRKI